MEDKLQEPAAGKSRPAIVGLLSTLGLIGGSILIAVVVVKVLSMVFGL